MTCPRPRCDAAAPTRAGGVARPACGATNDVLGLTCDRPPHPPGTAHYQDDGNGVRAWYEPSSDLPKEEDRG